MGWSVFVKVEKTKARPPQDGFSKEWMLKLMYSLWGIYKEKLSYLANQIHLLFQAKFDISTSNYYY